MFGNLICMTLYLYVIYEQRERVFHRDIQMDIPVRHELELFIWLLNESRRNRMFSFADLDRIPNEAYRN